MTLVSFAVPSVVDEEMDGIAREQRHRLETVKAELAEVRRRLDRLYNLVETTDLNIDDFKPSIRDHRERQEKLEASAAEARAMLSERRDVLDDVETIAAYAQDLSVFLNESEMTERRAFIESFVKEIVVMPGDALVRYTIPISQSTPKSASLVGGGPEDGQVATGRHLSTPLRPSFQSPKVSGQSARGVHFTTAFYRIQRHPEIAVPGCRLSALCGGTRPPAHPCDFLSLRPHWQYPMVVQAQSQSRSEKASLRSKLSMLSLTLRIRHRSLPPFLTPRRPLPIIWK